MKMGVVVEPAGESFVGEARQSCVQDMVGHVLKRIDV